MATNYAHHPWRLPVLERRPSARTRTPATCSSCAYRFYRRSDFGFRVLSSSSTMLAIVWQRSCRDNLRIGRTVIADSVNPIPLSRDEIEVICSDTKNIGIGWKRAYPAFPDRDPYLARRSLTRLPPWNRDHIVIDTANRTVEQVVTILRGAMPKNASADPPSFDRYATASR